VEAFGAFLKKDVAKIERGVAQDAESIRNSKIEDDLATTGLGDLNVTAESDGLTLDNAAKAHWVSKTFETV